MTYREGGQGRKGKWRGKEGNENLKGRGGLKLLKFVWGQPNGNFNQEKAYFKPGKT